MVAVLTTSGGGGRAGICEVFRAFALEQGERVPIVRSFSQWLPGCGSYRFLGFLLSDGVPWAFAIYFGEPATDNTVVVDMDGHTTMASERSHPVLVRDGADVVLYVSGVERVKEPDHHILEAGDDAGVLGWEGRLSKTHRALVLRKVSEGGNEVLDSAVYSEHAGTEADPPEVAGFESRVQKILRSLHVGGTVIAE